MAKRETVRLTADQLADLFRLLGDPGRLRLVFFLLQEGEAFGQQIRAATGMSQPSVSNNLSLFQRCGVVEHRRDGKRVYYRVSNPFVNDLLRTLAER